MVTEESQEVGKGRPTYALFVHLQGHIATCPDACRAVLGQKLKLNSALIIVYVLVEALKSALLC